MSFVEVKKCIRGGGYISEYRNSVLFYFELLRQC